MSGYDTKIKYPTSLAFAATWRRYRAHQEPEPGRPVRDRRVAMGEFGGQGLVQAGADIQIGDEVSLEITVFGQHQSGQPRVVAAIDKESRAGTDEWLITWAQIPAQRDGGWAPAVVLDPERFTDVMLIWAYEQTGGGRSNADLCDFAPGDIPVLCAIPLAEHLQDQGLLLRHPGPNSVVRMTAHGVATAQIAIAERDNRTLRIKTLRNRIILWIHTMSETEEYLDLRNFLHDPSAVFRGRFFTEADLHEEAAYLRGKGLLHEIDLPWCLYPALTPKGRDCAIDHGGNVHESTNPKPQQNNTIINIGDNNQNSTGDGAQTAYARPPTARPPQEAPENPAHPGTIRDDVMRKLHAALGNPETIGLGTALIALGTIALVVIGIVTYHYMTTH